MNISQREHGGNGESSPVAQRVVNQMLLFGGSGICLFEGDSDPVLLDPHDPTAPDYAILLGHELKMGGDESRIGHLNGRPLRRNVQQPASCARSVGRNVSRLVGLDAWMFAAIVHCGSDSTAAGLTKHQCAAQLRGHRRRQPFAKGSIALRSDEACAKRSQFPDGRVAEWFKAPVLKFGNSGPFL